MLHKFTSSRGNTGLAETEEEARRRAEQLDQQGCTNCWNCTNCWHCSGCADCIDCAYCAYCAHCTGCEGCTSCKDCTGLEGGYGVLSWNPPNAQTSVARKLLALNGLGWPVATDGERIQIGCKNYTAQEWRDFSDSAIKRMAPGALEFWRTHKVTILALADHRLQ